MIAEVPVSLPRSTQFDMHSEASGRDYRVFVSKPVLPPPPAGYPVFLLTDGNLGFPIAAGLNAAFVMEGRGALVVAVGYPTDELLRLMSLRNRDLTPPTPLSGIRQRPGYPALREEDVGGADAFFRFLTQELVPALAASHPVDTANMTLFGHSLGGLFALHVLFNHPGAFRTIAASSPSIWWNRRAVLKGERNFARRVTKKEIASRILITIGATEQEPPHTLPPTMTPAQLKKLLREARMVDNARELAARLKKVKGSKGYKVAFEAFRHEDHTTVMGAAITRAITFALRPDKAR